MTRRIHFIRHAQSTHNEFSFTNKGVDPMFFDAPLSQAGLEEAHQLREELARKKLEVDLVVVSPMTRALQTYSIAFAEFESVRVVVNQLCHEKIANACDLGSAKVQLSQKFPTLCFDEVNDLWWYRPSKHINLHNYKQLWKENAYKEDLEHYHTRLRRFKTWLLNRTEKEIAVVSHSSFIRDLLGHKEKLGNCEVFTLDVETDSWGTLAVCTS